MKRYQLLVVVIGTVWISTLCGCQPVKAENNKGAIVMQAKTNEEEGAFRPSQTM